MSRQPPISAEHATRADSYPCSLPVTSLATKAVALIAAGAATLFCVGSQIGLLTVYSGEAQQIVARFQPATKADPLHLADARRVGGLNDEGSVSKPAPLSGQPRP